MIPSRKDILKSQIFRMLTCCAFVILQWMVAVEGGNVGRCVHDAPEIAFVCIEK